MLYSKIDKHPLDRILTPFGNKWVALTLFSSSTLFGFLSSCKYNDWQWLNRFGAIDQVPGIILTTSSLFNRGINKSQSTAAHFVDITPDNEFQITSPEERRIGNNVFLGVMITVIGTIINAFGDKIAHLIVN